LLSFAAEPFVFQFVFQKYKDYNIQKFNFTYCLYVCETWSLKLREECRLRKSENSVLRKIFGHKWDKVTSGWSRLHIKELNGLYSSQNIIQVI